MYDEDKNEVTVTGEHQVATTGGGGGLLEGLEGGGASDLIIPRRSVCYPESKMEGMGVPAGHFVSSLDPSNHKESVRCTLLKAHKGRVWFEEMEDKPSCGSDNGLVPASRFGNPPSPTCVTMGPRGEEAVCEYAEWGYRSNGKAKPPACSGTWNLLMLDLDEMMPFWISLKGTSYKSTKTLFTNLKLIAQRSGRNEVCCGEFTMGLDRMEKPRVYFIVRFTGFKVLEDDLYLPAKELFTQFQGENLSDEVTVEESYTPGGGTQEDTPF